MINDVPCPFSDHCALLLPTSLPDVVPLVLGCGNLIPLSYLRMSIMILSPLLSAIGAPLSLGLTIQYCCERSKALFSSRDLLGRLVDHRTVKVDSGFSTCVGPYHSALPELAKLDLEAAKGVQVRSRVRWVEEGESSSA